jgi:hypothetical protein
MLDTRSRATSARARKALSSEVTMLHAFLILSLLSPAPTASADSLDACALFTRDEVAKAAGEEARKPRPSSVNPAIHSSCTTTSSTSQLSVHVYIERKETKEMLQMSLKALKGVAKGQTSQALKPVSGLGDEAYWGQISPTNGQFHVIIGTTMLGINTYGKGPGAGTMEKTRPIADLVVKRFKERYGK